MSIHDPHLATPGSTPELSPLGWRARLRRKKESALLVREAEWAAESIRLQTILSDARRLVEENWVRGAWFAVREDDGRTRLVRGGRAIRLTDSRIVGSCLVGSIIRAGGGGGTLRDQPVQRALDAVWHALREPDGAEVQWCPSPATRLQHLRDLTRWNDYEARSTTDVSSLLLTAERIVLVSN